MADLSIPYTFQNDVDEIDAGTTNTNNEAIADFVNTELVRVDGTSAFDSADAARLAIPDSTINGDKIADDTVEWKFFDETVLGGTGTTISVDDIPTSSRVKAVFYIQDSGGTIFPKLRLNSDSSTHYAYRRITNGTNVSEVSPDISSIFFFSSATAEHMYGTFEILNVAAQRKLLQGDVIREGGANVTSAPDITQLGGKVDLGTDAVTEVELLNHTGATGTFGSGSYLKIFIANE